MAVKNISTRMKICGRTAKCTGGHSAVEQSGYICRETMYSEYDGKIYYPKYAEDLVHSEVLTPENAPEEYKDPKVLWNAVEMNEKKDDAQLARTWRIELPNLWTYAFAIMFVRELCERLFVSKGMCVQFAIHDSENEKGQRNLHAHIMLTMRSIDEQGHWMPKQKKVYLTDENGERIPVIDEKTGQQKVDKRNRKQWKCTTIKTNDWDDQKYGKLWRKELTDAINNANAELGLTQDHWEHHSFKEQGLDIIPQIHLGEKASAMERAGIQTIRGNINRDIIMQNAIINAARMAVEKAKEELAEAMAIPVTIVRTFKSEIIDVIRKMCERNNNRLTLPIMKGKFIGAVSDRAALQDKEKMEAYVQSKGWTTFDEMQADRKAMQTLYDSTEKDKDTKEARIGYLEKLLAAYDDYEPYIKFHKEQWALKGFKRKMYERKHIPELAYYDSYRNRLKGMIIEADKKITPKKWRDELKELKPKYEKAEKSLAGMMPDLAKMEVLSYNKRDLERMLANENQQHEIEISRNKKKGIER